MTVTGALIAVISRKVRALIAEVRALVHAAKTLELQIVGDAKAEVKRIEARAAADVSDVRNNLIDRINKL